MDIKQIPVTKIKPNNYNPNLMSELQYQHLNNEYQRVGYLQPVLVRPLKKHNYEIVDGEHRWRVAKEQGLEQIHCVVKELDDEQAKITTINMNRIKGSNHPLKFAEVLDNLSKVFDIDELSQLLNMNEKEIMAYDILKNMEEPIPYEPEDEPEPEPEEGYIIELKFDYQQFNKLVRKIGNTNITKAIKQYLLEQAEDNHEN